MTKLIVAFRNFANAPKRLHPFNSTGRAMFLFFFVDFVMLYQLWVLIPPLAAFLYRSNNRVGKIDGMEEELCLIRVSNLAFQPIFSHYYLSSASIAYDSHKVKPTSDVSSLKCPEDDSVLCFFRCAYPSCLYQSIRFL
jgi:hypothetical protein